MHSLETLIFLNEQAEAEWCVCAYKPEGHQFGIAECLFAPPELRSHLCPRCLQPAQTHIVKEYGGTPYETFRSAITLCCGEYPLKPNGQDAEIEDCE